MMEYFNSTGFINLLRETMPTHTLPEGVILTTDRDYTLAMSYVDPCGDSAVNDAGAEWESYIQSGMSAFRSNYFIYAQDEMEAEAEKQGVKPRIIRRDWRKSQLRVMDSIFNEFFKDSLIKLGLLELQDIYSIYLEVCLLSFDNDDKKFSQVGQALTMILLSGGIIAGFWPDSPGGVWPDGKLVVYWPYDFEPKYEQVKTYPVLR